MQLAGMLGVSLLCVLALGSATFAWYSAEAEVRISSVSAQTTITTAGPLDVTPTLYKYNGNGSNGYILEPGSEAEGAPTLSTTFSDSFTAFDNNENISITGWYPGYKQTYCLGLTAVSAGTITIDLSKFTNTNNTGETRYIYSSGTTTTPIEMGYAINIYTHAPILASSWSANATSTTIAWSGDDSSDKFKYTSANRDSYASANLYSGSIAASTLYYFFFTIEFSNLSNTWYHEVNVSGTQIYAPGSGTRYFLADSTANGDSSSYMGLKFKMDTIGIY